mmetsp:Transcript_46369/g.68057  ORF Transcript_46369/g.68057 Transcript_46369/m.68057 type:complete len:361 (-) Transcript_46369:8912-9994(-)
MHVTGCERYGGAKGDGQNVLGARPRCALRNAPNLDLSHLHRHDSIARCAERSPRVLSALARCGSIAASRHKVPGIARNRHACSSVGHHRLRLGGDAGRAANGLASLLRARRSGGIDDGKIKNNRFKCRHVTTQGEHEPPIGLRRVELACSSCDGRVAQEGEGLFDGAAVFQSGQGDCHAICCKDGRVQGQRHMDDVVPARHLAALADGVLLPLRTAHGERGNLGHCFIYHGRVQVVEQFHDRQFVRRGLERIASHVGTNRKSSGRRVHAAARVRDNPGDVARRARCQKRWQGEDELPRALRPAAGHIGTACLNRHERGRLGCGARHALDRNAGTLQKINVGRHLYVDSVGPAGIRRRLPD